MVAPSPTVLCMPECNHTVCGGAVRSFWTWDNRGITFVFCWVLFCGMYLHWIVLYVGAFRLLCCCTYIYHVRLLLYCTLVFLDLFVAVCTVTMLEYLSMIVIVIVFSHVCWLWLSIWLKYVNMPFIITPFLPFVLPHCHITTSQHHLVEETYHDPSGCAHGCHTEFYKWYTFQTFTLPTCY